MKVYVVRVTEEVRRPESRDLYLCQNYVAGVYSSKENAAKKIIKEGDSFFKGKRDGVIDYFDHSKEIDRIASASSSIIGGGTDAERPYGQGSNNDGCGRDRRIERPL